MKVQLRSGNNPLTLKGMAFDKCYLLIEGVGAAALTNADFNLVNLRSTLTVKQAGVEDTTSFNAVGPVIKGLIDSKDPGAYANNTFAASGTTCRGILRGGTATQSTIRVPLLEGGYLLRGDDCIELNIEVLSGLFSANSQANSYVYLVTEEANGIVQTDINIPRYEPIDNSRQQVSFSYDGASEIYFLNSGTYSATANPLTSIEVRSAYVADRFDAATLDALRGYRIPATANQGNSILYAVEPNALYDVTVNASIATASVTAGANFLYVNKVLSGKFLAARGLAQSIKIQKRNLSKRGL
jgi:hypothetical protein